MSNPYKGLPDTAFWRKSLPSDPFDFDPVTGTPPFLISLTDKVAAAGSCFAQHITKTLAKQGFCYHVTELGPLTQGAADEGYGVFSARFGNIYSTRQLLQLFDRAYGLFSPTDGAWKLDNGRYIDPFRPQIQTEGFETEEALIDDRVAHFAAVREMFETCDVFIFTFGLTECWISKCDGSAYPLAPGVALPSIDMSGYTNVNFSVAAMMEDMRAFLAKLFTVNASVRLVFTVSPVPLIATAERRHVVVSTTYSKSSLRVVAEQVVAENADRAIYFPSYEIATSPVTHGHYFEEDMRSVKPEGVAAIMGVFSSHFLVDGDGKSRKQISAWDKVATQEEVAASVAALRKTSEIICDEEAIEASVA